MHAAYLVITIRFAAMVAFSGLGKIRRDPHKVRVVHETVGVPLKLLPLLAACEFAGTLGLMAGIWWAALGIAAGVGLVLYFVGAIVSHLRSATSKALGLPPSCWWSQSERSPCASFIYKPGIL
jgi:hypothetical protein